MLSSAARIRANNAELAADSSPTLPDRAGTTTALKWAWAKAKAKTYSSRPAVKAVTLYKLPDKSYQTDCIADIACWLKS
jgi:hypothetical protein